MKKLSAYEMYKQINELLGNTEGLVKGAAKPDCVLYYKPLDKEYVRIFITTNCEDFVIGTYYIDHIPEKDTPPRSHNTCEIWSELITVYDDPYRIVKRMLRSIERYNGVD